MATGSATAASRSGFPHTGYNVYPAGKRSQPGLGQRVDISGLGVRTGLLQTRAPVRRRSPPSLACWPLPPSPGAPPCPTWPPQNKRCIGCSAAIACESAASCSGWTLRRRGGLSKPWPAPFLPLARRRYLWHAPCPGQLVPAWRPRPRFSRPSSRHYGLRRFPVPVRVAAGLAAIISWFTLVQPHLRSGWLF